MLSRFLILSEEARTFQNLPWASIPDARLPDDPETAEPDRLVHRLNVATGEISPAPSVIRPSPHGSGSGVSEASIDRRCSRIAATDRGFPADVLVE